MRGFLILLATVFALPGAPALAQQITPSQSAELDTLLIRQKAATRIPGLGLIVRRRGEIVYQRALGVAGDGAPFTTETPVWLGSLSKSFTALAVAQLAAADRLKLDAPVARYLPAFKPSAPEAYKITVRNLIEQATGLTDRNLPDWDQPWPRTFEQSTARVRAVTWLASTPGTRHAYHNANYMLLGNIVEQVSGKTYQAYLKQHIFSPLGMHSARAVNLLSDASDVPPGHMFVLGRPVPVRVAGMFVGGAGGVIASASDLSRWVEAFATAARSGHSRIVPGQQLAEMLHPGSRSPYLYRFGWVVRQPGTKLIRHNGGLPTFVAHAAFSPDGNLSIVVVTNASLANPTWSEVGEDITDGAVAILSGHRHARIAVRQIGPLVEGGFAALALFIAGICVWLARPSRWRRRRAKVGGRALLLLSEAAAAPVAIVILVLVAVPFAFGFVESWSWYWLWYLSAVGTTSLWLVAGSAVVALLLRLYGSLSTTSQEENLHRHPGAYTRNVGRSDPQRTWRSRRDHPQRRPRRGAATRH